MNKIHFHINEIGWKSFTEKEWGPLRWKELLNRGQGDSKEFIFGLAELPPGGRLPFHRHIQTETDYILSGRARIRLGLRSVEVGSSSAVYFLGKAPHSIETLGSEPLRYIYAYACEKLGHQIDLEHFEENNQIPADIENWIEGTYRRWAIREEVGELFSIEPSKGYKVRGMRLFDQQHGDAHEMKVGTFQIDPGIHYSLHYHDQPEIYYVISGRGVIYAEGSAIEASPGLALYLGARVVHGADNLGEEPLHLYYIYGTEIAGQARAWTPVEDIYTEVRWPR